jgi:hypothetical protein
MACTHAFSLVTYNIPVGKEGGSVPKCFRKVITSGNNDGGGGGVTGGNYATTILTKESDTTAR